MAKSVGGDKKPRGKKKEGAAPEGRNALTMSQLVDRLKEVAPEFIEDLDKLHADHETDTGNFMSDVGKKYEDMASKTGISRAICRKVYTRLRRQAKEAAADKELEKPKADELRALSKALGVGTGLGAYAAKKAEEAGG